VTPSDWDEVDGALERTFEFPGFAESIAFVNRLGELAESENHIRTSRSRTTTSRVRWWTHTAGGITDRDRALAARTDEL
jgi:4a-hydroxytetrahydrobiopterin dehydratase